MKKTIHIYSQYYRPVSNAPANRIEKYVKALKDDYDIKIITWMPNYPTWIKPPKYRYKLFFKEKWPYWEQIIRTYELASKNEWFLRRTLNYISYMLSSFLYGLFIKKPDLIIVTSPPLFSAIGVMWLSKLKKIPYIVEIRDLWPDSVVELGLMKKSSLIYKIFSWFENKIYQNASKIIVVTKGIQKAIEQKWFEKTILQYNVIDIENLPEFSNQQLEEIKKQFNIPSDKQFFLYAGNHSPAQNLRNIIQLAQDYPQWEFFMLWDGESKQQLEDFAKENNINNIHFLGYQPKQIVYKFIQIADYCITSLEESSLFEDAIPTKTLEYLAYWKLAIAFLKWDLADKINQYKAWIAMPKYDKTLINKLQSFEHLPENSIQLIKDHFSFKSFRKNILTLLNQYLWKK